MDALSTRRLSEDLERLLSRHRATLFKKQHRDGRLRRRFHTAGSFKVGTGSTNAGHLAHVRAGNPHFVRHPFRNTGVNVRPVREQTKLSPTQRAVYELARAILERVDPAYAAGDFLVQFAWISDAAHYVKRHVDKDDIAHQYALALGDYEGRAALRVHSEDGHTTEMDYKGRIVKFDGRLPHEVAIGPDFRGNRFVRAPPPPLRTIGATHAASSLSHPPRVRARPRVARSQRVRCFLPASSRARQSVIWYKTYDGRLAAPAPVVASPQEIEL